MIGLFKKIITTKPTVISAPNTVAEPDLLVVGEAINERVKKLFHGSLAIRQIDAGSDNACEQELVALTNSYYDVERFGIHFVASPKHADLLLITGPVTRNMVKALRHAYAVTPDPKIVVAVGDDAINGGIYRGSYASADGVNDVIPVNYCIPGDPPSPLTILTHLLRILN
ncbi:MAG: hypothetical protein WCV88_04720 [Patescibacteria group bacterium]